MADLSEIIIKTQVGNNIIKSSYNIQYFLGEKIIFNFFKKETTEPRSSKLLRAAQQQL